MIILLHNWFSSSFCFGDGFLSNNMYTMLFTHQKSDKTKSKNNESLRFLLSHRPLSIHRFLISSLKMFPFFNIINLSCVF